MTYFSIDYAYIFFFNDSPTPELYTYLHTLFLHDALPSFVRILACLLSGVHRDIRLFAGTRCRTSWKDMPPPPRRPSSLRTTAFPRKEYTNTSTTCSLAEMPRLPMSGPEPVEIGRAHV